MPASATRFFNCWAIDGLGCSLPASGSWHGRPMAIRGDRAKGTDADRVRRAGTRTSSPRIFVAAYLLILGWIERVAGHIRVPVRKRAVRIVLPRPHVQRIEGIQAEAIGAVEEMKQLPLQLGWPFVIGI